MSIVGTDTRATVDLPIFGNNKEFPIIVQTIKFILSIIKPRPISEASAQTFELSKKQMKRKTKLLTKNKKGLVTVT